MADFEFRDKIEGWVEGIIDVIQTYLWTILLLNLRPFSSLLRLTSEEDDPRMSSPSTYLVLSYLLMCLLIHNVDFSDRLFSLDIAKRLDALGVLDAAKTVNIETLVKSIFPAILFLLFFVIVTTTILRIAGDALDGRLVRRNYSFALGGLFLVVGTLCGGYHYLVKPIAARSWWLGLPVHLLTMLPFMNAIGPMLAIQYIGRPTGATLFVRWVAIMVPVIALSLLLKTTVGSFYLLDYMRLRQPLAHVSHLATATHVPTTIGKG
jgi:hypothetical protein